MPTKAEQLRAKLAQVKSAERPTADEPEIDEGSLDGGKKAIGRPRVKIDLELVRKLGFIHCTEKEIAAVVGVDVTTLRHYPGFLATWEEGKDRGKKALRRAMWKLAMSGNYTMQIWLSKNELSMREPRFEGAFTGTMKLNVVREDAQSAQPTQG